MLSKISKPNKEKDEDAVKQYISEVLDETLGEGSLQSVLLDGILLCRFIQRLFPSEPFTYNENKNNDFACRDNIGRFLCRIGELQIVYQTDSFQTVDLFEGKNMQSVISCILAIKRKLTENKKGSSVNLKADDDKRKSQKENHKDNKVHPHSLQEGKRKSSRILGKLNPTISKKNSYLDTHFQTYSSQRRNTKEDEEGHMFSRRKENTIGYATGNSDDLKTPQSPKDKSAGSANGEQCSVKSKVELYNKPHPEQVSHPLKSCRQPKQRVSLPLYLVNPRKTSGEMNDETCLMKLTTVLQGDLRGSTSENGSAISMKEEKSGETKKADKLFVESNIIYPTPSKSTPLETEMESQPTECNMAKFNQSDANRKASLKKMGSCKVIVVTEEGLKSEYAIGKSIGKGQYGEVYGGLNMNTGEYVAIKRIRRNDMECDDMKEVDLLKELDSEHIVHYKGYSKDSEFLNIVLEYIEMGSLRSNIKSFGKFPENLAASYTYKTLSGLKYLHEESVIHCDLKAANILITKTGNLKLTDFGVSLNSKMKDDDTGEPFGTPNWMAPEVIAFNRPTEKSDIWSLGCTIVEMLTGKPPYGNMPSFTALYKIVEDKEPPIPKNIDLSEDALEFLQSCFKKDPAERPTASELMKYKWVQSFVPSNHKIKPCLDTNDVLKIKKAKSDSSLFTPEKVMMDFKKARPTSQSVDWQQQQRDDTAKFYKHMEGSNGNLYTKGNNLDYHLNSELNYNNKNKTYIKTSALNTTLKMKTKKLPIPLNTMNNETHLKHNSINSISVINPKQHHHINPGTDTRICS